MIIVIATLILVVSQVLGGLVSPCPDVFQYETSPNFPDRWHGVIDVSADLIQFNLWVYIQLDRDAHIFTSGKGIVSSTNPREFLIERQDILSTLRETVRPEKYNIVASYDYAQPIPRLKIIRVNGREICRDNNTYNKDKPSFPTRPLLPHRLLLAKMNATNYIPAYLEISQNKTK